MYLPAITNDRQWQENNQKPRDGKWTQRSWSLRVYPPSREISVGSNPCTSTCQHHPTFCSHKEKALCWDTQAWRSGMFQTTPGWLPVSAGAW